MNIFVENLSVVIVAKDFNISIFKPFWLLKNNILNEQELQGNIVITPPAVHIPTDNFVLMVLPDRLQMTMPRQYRDAKDDIARILGGIIKTLPHTPYTALGLNFNYFVAPEAEDAFSSWNKQLLASSLSNKIYPEQDEGTRFGSYLSFDVLGTRLKIDIKPVKAPNNIATLCNSWHKGQDLVRLNFNFHRDIISSEPPTQTVLDTLGKWSEALALSEQFTAMIPE